MGSLAKHAPVRNDNPLCSILQRAEDAADLEAIKRVMGDRSFSGRQISEWLGASRTTIGEHRRANCGCCGGDDA